MLKKAGIVVAGSAAALLALSPLAFAGEGHHHGGPRGHQESWRVDYRSDDQVNSYRGKTTSANGLVAVNDVNALNNLNVCPSITAPIGIGGVLGILASQTANGPTSGGDATCSNGDTVSQLNLDD